MIKARCDITSCHDAQDSEAKQDKDEVFHGSPPCFDHVPVVFLV